MKRLLKVPYFALVCCLLIGGCGNEGSDNPVDESPASDQGYSEDTWGQINWDTVELEAVSELPFETSIDVHEVGLDGTDTTTPAEIPTTTGDEFQFVVEVGQNNSTYPANTIVVGLLWMVGEEMPFLSDYAPLNLVEPTVLQFDRSDKYDELASTSIGQIGFGVGVIFAMYVPGGGKPDIFSDMLMGWVLSHALVFIDESKVCPLEDSLFIGFDCVDGIHVGLLDHNSDCKQSGTHCSCSGHEGATGLAEPVSSLNVTIDINDEIPCENLLNFW